MFNVQRLPSECNYYNVIIFIMQYKGSVACVHIKNLSIWVPEYLMTRVINLSFLWDITLPFFACGICALDAVVDKSLKFAR